LRFKQRDHFVGEMHHIVNLSAKSKLAAIKRAAALINVAAVTAFHFRWRRNIAF